SAARSARARCGSTCLVVGGAGIACALRPCARYVPGSCDSVAAARAGDGGTDRAIRGRTRVSAKTEEMQRGRLRAVAEAGAAWSFASRYAAVLLLLVGSAVYFAV